MLRVYVIMPSCVSAICLSEYESHREAKDVVSAAGCEDFAVAVRYYVACGLVEAYIIGYVKEYAAYLYSQAGLPKVGLVVEHLLQIVIFEVLELLFAQRWKKELCSWTGEDAQTVASFLHNVETKENRHLHAVCPQVVDGVVGYKVLFAVRLPVMKIEVVVGDAERAFGLQVELPLCHPGKKRNGISYLVALYVVRVKLVALDAKFGVVVCHSLETGLHSNIVVYISSLLCCGKKRENCNQGQYKAAHSHILLLLYAPTELAYEIAQVEIFAVGVHQRVGSGKVPLTGYGVEVAVVGLYVHNLGKEHVV